MSKLIPQEEYNKKPLTQVLQWIQGDADLYQSAMELQKPLKTGPMSGWSGSTEGTGTRSSRWPGIRSATVSTKISGGFTKPHLWSAAWH